MTTRRRNAPSFTIEKERNGQVGTFTSSEINPYQKQPQSQSLTPSSSEDMSIGRDRTSEFLSAVKSMQSKTATAVNYSANRQNLPNLRSEFMYVAKKIGHDLSNTFSKLEKLTILAKRKSLFDDKPVEIQELTYIIRQDINTLNNQIGQLQQLMYSERGANTTHIRTHSNAVVVGLQSKLANMSGEFKNVLEVRTQNLKDQKNRREHFSQAHIASDGMVGANAGSVLLNDEHNSGDYSINMDLTERERYTRQLQLIDEQDSYIQDRADTMQNIEQTIVELGGIFQQLAHMVKEQEETVQRIDSNVEDTQLNVEAAHGEILKYFQSVTSNRWLMIKVFGILIVFFIIFVVFLA